MSATQVPLIEQSAQKTRMWIGDLAGELGRPQDLDYAFRVLRSFLHTWRDRLPVEEAAHLAAQLPEFLRGVYYEGWRPARTPLGYHDLETFLDVLARDGRLAGETEAAYAAEAAARVARRHLGAGELDKIEAVLPAGIAHVLAQKGSG